jgi:hypothetical protein
VILPKRCLTAEIAKDAENIQKITISAFSANSAGNCYIFYSNRKDPFFLLAAVIV